MFIKTIFILLFTFVVIQSYANKSEMTDNVDGPYQVPKGFHYANKTSIEWGRNSELSWSVTVSLASELATYDCTTSCDDTAWYADWNKLWGKTRCGYATGVHEESDR